MKRLLLVLAFCGFSSLGVAQPIQMAINFHDASFATAGNSEVNKAIDIAARPDKIIPVVLVGKKGLLRNKSAYFPSSLISDDVTEKIMEIAGSSDSRVAAQSKSLFIKADVERLFESIYGPVGFKRNDLADATAAYWIIMWMSVNQKGFPPGEQIQKIRNQAYDGLANEKFLNKTDAQKQYSAQIFMWKAILVYMVLQDPRTDHRVFAQLAQQRTQNLGFEFPRTLLTKDGFLLPKK
jgi:hypothetical protein